MAINQLLFTLMSAFLAAGSLWFYSHCARPALAYEGARRSAFWVVIGATLVVAIGVVVGEIDLLVAFPSPLDRALDLSKLLGGAIAIPALAFLKPHWLVIVTGGPDSSVPVRFTVSWYRRHWRRVEPDDRKTPVRLANGMVIALDRLGPPADAALADEWRERATGVIEASALGWTTFDRTRRDLGDALNEVKTVDGLFL